MPRYVIELWQNLDASNVPAAEGEKVCLETKQCFGVKKSGWQLYLLSSCTLLTASVGWSVNRSVGQSVIQSFSSPKLSIDYSTNLL